MITTDLRSLNWIIFYVKDNNWRAIIQITINRRSECDYGLQCSLVFVYIRVARLFHFSYSLPLLECDFHCKDCVVSRSVINLWMYLYCKKTFLAFTHSSHTGRFTKHACFILEEKPHIDTNTFCLCCWMFDYFDPVLTDHPIHSRKQGWYLRSWVSVRVE